MINVIFNDFSYELLPKRKEIFEKYTKIIQWGRANCVWLMGRNSGKSFLAAPFMMARALLLPNTNTYIMAPSGGQSQETFQKMEDMAKGNIASLLGTSSVFLDECIRANTQADPFTHPKSGYTVSLYNGSTINTLNSVIKNIVGIRQENCRFKMKPSFILRIFG